MSRPPSFLLDENELIALLYEADRHPLGAVVQTNTPERLRQYLYPLMDKTGIRFALQIPAKAGELWLVRKD